MTAQPFEIAIDPIAIVGVTAYHPDPVRGGHHYLHGHTEILGCTFHARFVRIRDYTSDPDDPWASEPYADAPPTVHEIFESFMALDDGCWTTVKVSGQPGHYALVLHPYQD